MCNSRRRSTFSKPPSMVGRRKQHDGLAACTGSRCPDRQWRHRVDVHRARFRHDLRIWNSGTNLRERWIEIGAKWTADQVCYFVDGVMTACENYRWVTNDGSSANPTTVVMFLAIGAPWAGRNGIDDAAFPVALEVDYIRVYQRAEP